jgi:hypothetical protein
MNNLDIFICTHKNFNPPVNNDIYKIIKLNNHNLNIQNTNLKIFDDTINDNIAYKQYGYSEMSAIYWVWKNYNIKKYIGFNHYRRFFDFKDNIQNITDIFNSYDIITPKPILLDETVYQNYMSCHYEEDLITVKNIISEYLPQYNTSFFNYIENSYTLYPCNMFIMKKNDFIDYCNFMFLILFNYDKFNNIKTTQDIINIFNNRKEKTLGPNYQARVQGFLAERLTTLYIQHNFNDNNIYKIPYITTNDNGDTI